MNSFTIYLLSDIHIGNSLIYPSRKKVIKHLIDSNELSSSDVIVLAGDLTDDGTGYTSFLCCSCPNNVSNSDQVKDFVNQVYIPIRKKYPNLLICHGNHDESKATVPMLEFITHEYLSTKEGCYCKVINGVMFVVLGKYPDKTALSFFDMVRVSSKDMYPYVVIFHYQLDTNHGYDFWSQTEKKVFEQYISNVPNVLCILHGHIHMNYGLLFAGIPTFCGSDLNGYYKITVTDNKLTYCIPVTI